MFYVKSPPITTHREIHFNALPEQTRRRFCVCVHEKERPFPMLSMRPTHWAKWVGALVLGLLISFSICGGGFNQRLIPAGTMPLLAVGFYLVIAGVLPIVRHFKLKAALPFPPGIYLFPIDLVDARGVILQLYSMGTLKDLRTTHRYCNNAYTHTTFELVFPGKSFTFSVRGKQNAEDRLTMIRAFRQAVAQAVEAKDYQALNQLDPFIEARLSDTWQTLSAAPPVNVVDSGAGWRAGKINWSFALPWRVWATAAVAALALTPIIWLGENLARDVAVFAEARRRDQPYAYRYYLREGWMFRDKACDLLAESVFRDAKESRHVSAMRRFLEEFPNDKRAADAREFIHELYNEALQKLRRQADSTAVEFLERLFAYLEKENSPPLEVRFRPPSQEALTATDDDLKQKGQKFKDLTMALVSPSFTDEQCQRRESSIATSLERGFKAVVPIEIMRLTMGPRMETGKRPGRLTKPTVLINYQVKTSGAVYTTESRKRGYVGIEVAFVIIMRIPGDPRPFRFELSVLPPSHFTVRYNKNKAIESALNELNNKSADIFGPSDSSVYNVMAEEAFKKLDDKLTTMFFHKS